MDRELLFRVIEELDRLSAELRAVPTGPCDGTPEQVDRAQWLSGILAHSPDVISILDVDGTLRYISRAAPGRDPNGYVGRNAAEFLPPPDRERWTAAVQLALDTGQPQVVEVHSAGDYYWATRIVPVEQDGKFTWLLTIGTDVTARRKAEAALAVKGQQLELALEASGMGQWSFELKTNRFTWDAAGRKIFAWADEQEHIDRSTLLERVHSADRDRVAQSLASALDAGEFKELQCRIVLPDASVRWIVAKGRANRDPSGRVQGLLGGVLDITHGKRTDEQLQRSAKLEAIGQLAGGVAHDFNNLLVAILGNLDLVRSSDDEDVRRQCLDDAVGAANRAAELTRQLLVFGHRQRLDTAAVDCHELLEDTLRLLRRLLPETIQVELIRAHRLPRVHGDRGQLEQVIVNLCLNARDAMPDGGQLLIETEMVLVNGRFREVHPWARAGRYALVSISDTGVGIAPDQLDHIFEPFFTTKPQGTGLGLATAYGIVKRHEGLLHVYSELGKGTTFKIYLPVAERDAADVGPKVDAPVVGGTETVLLAEDEVSVRAVVTRILERAGYSVLAAKDGQEAVELFAEHRDNIQLLLFDAVMPRKGGNEALTEIRRLAPTIPAVLCSGYSEAPPLPESAGDVVFLAKPYEPDTLLRALRRLLEHAPEP